MIAENDPRATRYAEDFEELLVDALSPEDPLKSSGMSRRKCHEAMFSCRPGQPLPYRSVRPPTAAQKKTAPLQVH